jgi:hypothetical protein
MVYGSSSRSLAEAKISTTKEVSVTYLIPFKRWCHTLYKELIEFKERYTDEEVFDRLSKTLIIIDYRELHDVLREQGKYMGKVKEENSKVAEYLKKLENLVDNLWHSLQDIFSVNFDHSQHDEWIKAIIEYKGKRELCEYIKEHSKEILEHYKKEEFKQVTDYLQGQIPKW